MTNEELAILIKQGQTELYSELWKQNEKLFAMKSNSLYNKYHESCARSGVELEDILQCCFIALSEAVRAFKTDGEYKLTTYISYPLRTHFRELLGVRTSKRDPLNSCKSLDDPISEESEEATFSDFVPDDRAIKDFEEVEDSVFNSKLHEVLEAAMQSLTDEQIDVIKRRYYNSQTPEKIAEETEQSLQDIQRLMTQAQNGLRKPKSIKFLEPYANEILESYAYRGTGLNAFLYSGTSSVERAVIKANDGK